MHYALVVCLQKQFDINELKYNKLKAGVTSSQADRVEPLRNEWLHPYISLVTNCTSLNWLPFGYPFHNVRIIMYMNKQT